MFRYFITFYLISFAHPHKLINFANVPCGLHPLKQRHGKIIGGSDTELGEFPWMVSITRSGGHVCGGSLISSKHVLTAAHCICNAIDGYLEPRQIKVSVGQNRIKVANQSQEVLVRDIRAHPDYKCNKVRNDIAILELDNDVRWTAHVQPACLFNDHAGGSAIVTGWGWTSEVFNKRKQTGVMQKARVNIIENDVCTMWYKAQGKKTVIQESQMCAGFKEGGVDACWADSGGPLMIRHNASEVQSIVGIVSTGIGCARPFLPGIYTRVSKYIDWIRLQIFQKYSVN